MIFINLLPRPKKEPERAVAAKRSLRLIWLSGFVIFLAASVYNVYLFGRLRLEHHELESKWQALAPRNDEALRLEQELGPNIKAKIDFFNNTVNPMPEAARVLNLASDFVPAPIVLTEVSFQRKDGEFSISLNGSVESGQSESALIEIQKYAENLKNAVDEALGKAQSVISSDSKPSILMQVTTGRRKSIEEEGQVTEFQALLRTEGFKDK